MKKLIYIKRIIDAYIFKKTSQLSFWHGTPKLNEKAFTKTEKIPQYYMCFYSKANYSEITDDNGVPMLNYHGSIGLQYNPIAIAQYGLGNINLFLDTNEQRYYLNAEKVAEWFLNNLRNNKKGVAVWMHDFDFDYARLLKAPWYSGLAQGQILSFFIRMYLLSNNEKYRSAAIAAFKPLNMMIEEGGCLSVDENKHLWIEEYITEPSMHILNGFIWALWGVYDYAVLFENTEARELYSKLLTSLERRLNSFDCGFWSLYDLSGHRFLKNLASPFYHKLHLVQLSVMHRLTGNIFFKDLCDKWAAYESSYWKRKLAFFLKGMFKIFCF